MDTKRQFCSMNTTLSLVSALLGGILVYSGVEHLVNPYIFLRSITNYAILPAAACYWAAYFLPFIQLIVGTCLVFGLFEFASTTTSFVLFSTFFIAQTTALVRGLNIDCGCFGSNSSPITATSVAFVFALCVASAVLVRIKLCHAASGACTGAAS